MPDLIEDIDYYIDDNGLLVFTAHYLLKRGYCCGSGCRHCPYPKEEKIKSIEPDGLNRPDTGNDK